MRCSRIVVSSIAVAVLLVLPVGAGEMTAADVFAKLKAMDGAWVGVAARAEGEPEPGEEGAMAVKHVFRPSANGSVVMETMGPDTEHEMINMYHMDGDTLVMTHYCSAGNQPVMKLDSEKLAEGTVHFAFAGGGNLDVENDHHIHEATYSFEEDGSVVQDWIAWSGGEEVGVMRFSLERSE